jgi:RHS repeat-associated protein
MCRCDPQVPGVDEPVSMIDVEDSNATYYYHFDALGSVVALTNSSGSTVELYEYSVYGQVAASDANIPNRFMFTGREFDADTGLYYYRARYYNPEIGRFLQTDPIGYEDGMNWYRYCGNNPGGLTDASGCTVIGLYSFVKTEMRPVGENVADDFTVPYPMSSSAIAMWCVGDIGAQVYELGLIGISVDEVYLYGHSLYKNEVNPAVVGLRFLAYDAVDTSRDDLKLGEFDLQVLCRDDIKNDPDCKDLKINFRQCFVADADGDPDNGVTDLSFLKSLAEWTGCTVTGVAGPVELLAEERDGPDYIMHGDLWEVSPGGTPKRIWRCLTEAEKKTARGQDYLKKHPQPY